MKSIAFAQGVGDFYREMERFPTNFSLYSV